MVWEIGLTVWIVCQAIWKTIIVYSGNSNTLHRAYNRRVHRAYSRRGINSCQNGSVWIVLIWTTGIFVCLYMGGFYN